MFGAACVALGILASAIQWGWQPMADGGREYIVQVEPQLSDLDAFRKEGFSSDIPPGLRDIRRIRIVVGSEPLPNQGEIPPAEPTALAPPSGTTPTASQAPALQPGPMIPETTVPGALPSGVAAEPLKPARSVDASSAKVALADGHQPAGVATNGDEATAERTAPATGHSKARSPSDGPIDDEPASTASGISVAAPPRPWLTLLMVTGGLIVSLSGNVFLGWIHWGTRNHYRALVSQLRSQRSV